MSGIAAESIADLVTTTLNELGRNKWTDISRTLQDYVVLPMLLKKSQVVFQSGAQIQFNVKVATNGNARHVGLYGTDEVNKTDVMKTGSIPWRHSVTSYMIDEREVAMNRDPARIVDMVKVGRTDAMGDLAELIEDAFWGKPADSTDEVTPFGIDYWITGNNSEGFNGGNASGFASGPAGLSASTYTQWRNWTAQYAAVSKTDLIRKMRQAAVKTKFVPPVPTPEYDAGSISRALFTNYDVIQAMEEVLEDQNDNLGNDIAPKDGKLIFRGNPIMWVPKLDADTTDPIYGVNLADFKVALLSGTYMKESVIAKTPGQHNVTSVFVDMSYNFLARNRRSHFKINK